MAVVEGPGLRQNRAPSGASWRLRCAIGGMNSKRPRRRAPPGALRFACPELLGNGTAVVGSQFVVRARKAELGFDHLGGLLHGCTVR